MQEERRKNRTDTSYWLEQQQIDWRWQSHLWEFVRECDGVQCRWCGWLPLSGMALSLRNVKLCTKNPDIVALLGNVKDNVVKALEEEIP